MTVPRPVPDADTAPFWAALEAGRLELQHCRDCRRAVFYPRCVCPHCGGEALEWRPSPGRGAVHSFTVAHRAPPPFDAAVPLVFALIDLEEGVRMMSRLIDCDPRSVHIGAAVEVAIAALGDGPLLPYFRLAP
jgi:uncharacterized OB-fold protein